jgi:hypothetical protein
MKASQAVQNEAFAMDIGVDDLGVWCRFTLYPRNLTNNDAPCKDMVCCVNFASLQLPLTVSNTTVPPRHILSLNRWRQVADDILGQPPAPKPKQQSNKGDLRDDEPTKTEGLEANFGLLIVTLFSFPLFVYGRIVLSAREDAS